MSLADDLRRLSKPGLLSARALRTNLGAWARALFTLQRVRQDARKPAWTRPARLFIGALCALGAIALAMALFDTLAVTNQRRFPAWLVGVAEEISVFGRSSWVLAPTGVGLLLVAALSTQRLGSMSRLVMTTLAARLGFVFLAVAVPGLVVTVVKRLIGRARPRPYSYEITGPFDFAPFGWDVAYASFPSGHATTIFAASFAIGALYPRLRAPLWLLAILVALSRVAVAAHHPSDVVAGAIVGAFGALAVRNWFASQRLAFAVRLDRSVRPMPGPSGRRLAKALRALLRA